MSSATDRAIQAIRDIVGIKPEAIELLNAIGKRGTLKGVTVAADIAADQDECCSQKGNGGGDDDGRCDTQPGTIWCNPDEPWKDCQQPGKPVTIGAGGFPQAEACKECEPDPDWEQGFYWRAFTQLDGTHDDSAPSTCLSWLADKYPQTGTGFTLYYIGSSFSVDTETSKQGIYQVRRVDDGGQETIFDLSLQITRQSCDGSTEDYCTVTEAPESCGEDWEQDGTKDLAVINGCVTGSSCDPDATGADEKCKQCQDLCNDSGQTMRICATPDGGFVAYDPNGELKGGKYSSDGTRTEQYDAGDSGGWV